MLAATGGVNTHRGAIFCLGLIAATAGAIGVSGGSLTPEALRHVLVERWSAGIRALPVIDSHGGNAARRYGVRSARAEALAGYPAIFETGLPVLERTLAATGCTERASLQALMAIMAELDDTNLLHRGGREGLDFARAEARRFLDSGGVGRSDYRAALTAVHRNFCARGLSPGGAADMLAACWFVHFLCTS
jgi:triphosphoribosyl-dephospho-CoA synthase